MEPAIVIEVRDARGKLRQRERLQQFPVTIGRAYSSTVIVDDPHVDAAHLLVEQCPEGGLRLRDLGSVNGVRFPRSQACFESCPVESGLTVQIGQTTLTFVFPEHPVAPAIPVSTAKSSHERLNSTVVLCLLLIALLGRAVDTFVFTNAKRVDLSDVVGMLVFSGIGICSMTLAWAGGWALVSRLILHRARFWAHCGLFLICLAAFWLSERGGAYLGFAVGSDLAATCFRVGAGTVIGCAWLFYHLKFATALDARALRIFVGAVPVLIGLVAAAVWYSGRDAFDETFSVSGPIKPAAFKLAPDSSLAEFMSGADRLRGDLEESLARR